MRNILASSLFSVLAVFAFLLTPSKADSELPAVSIIIDDLGYSLDQARHAMSLPVEVTFSILPFTRYSLTIARHAGDQGREYMLHLPMESDHGINNDPGMLKVSMHKDTFLRSLQNNLNAIRGYAGINNHKGSALTANSEKMDVVLQALAARPGVFFVDSKTTAQSITQSLAARHGVPYASRSIFLDVDRNMEKIAQQFERLVRIAVRDGSAIGIAHPHPETLTALTKLLQNNESRRYRLVNVGDLLALRQ